MPMNCAAGATTRDTNTSTQGGRLDVEDDEARMHRIHNTLNKLSSSSNPSSSPSPFPPTASKFDFGDRTTYEVQPNSELLSRLHAFLPQLEASNAHLTTLNPESYNIELELTPSSDPSSEPSQYIEMNLGLGVFESKSAQEGCAMDVSPSASFSQSSDSTSSSSSSDNSSSSSDSETHTPTHEPEEYIPLSTFIRDHLKPTQTYAYDSDESDDEYDVEIVNTAFVPLPRKIKPLPRRAGAGKGGKGIVVIGEEGK